MYVIRRQQLMFANFARSTKRTLAKLRVCFDCVNGTCRIVPPRRQPATTTAAACTCTQSPAVSAQARPSSPEAGAQARTQSQAAAAGVDQKARPTAAAGSHKEVTATSSAIMPGGQRFKAFLAERTRSATAAKTARWEGVAAAEAAHWRSVIGAACSRSTAAAADGRCSGV